MRLATLETKHTEYSIYSAAVPTYLLFLLYLFRKNSQRKHAFNIKTQLDVYIHAYQHAARVSSKPCACAQVTCISNHDYSQPSWRILCPICACAQPNVGLSSAVFRSGVSCVQWQLEQKERYHATQCYVF